MPRANDESERIDLLLALSLAFGETTAEGAGHTRRDDPRGGGGEGVADAGDGVEPGGEGRSARGASEQGSDATRARDPLDPLSALGPAVRHAVERRAEWHARLPPQKQRAWLAHMLGRARQGPPQLDEHVHPSHVVEALSGEPARVRELVISHLPPALAEAAAAQLRELMAAEARATSRGGAAFDGDPLHVASQVATPSRDVRPAAEVEAVVRREFLSRFETFASLGRATAIEQLSGAELARLARLLGVRETAVACRGIGAIEAVASFLRRFASEDARAIAAHIKSLTEVEPRRVAAAERTVREAMLVEDDPAAMLDRAGLRLLALALAGRENRARLRYSAQKLPLEAARWLEASARAAESGTDVSDAETRRAVAREAEAVASGLLRGRHARRARQSAAHASEIAAGQDERR